MRGRIGIGFEELSFENQVEYDVGDLKKKIRRRVEIARDEALQDASGCTLFLLE